MFSVHPNPAENALNISYDRQIGKIMITDLTGKTIKEYTEGYKQLDISGITPGMYMIILYNSSGERFNQRFVKE